MAAGAGPAVVRTSKLELVDQAGKVRATLGVDEASGQTVLRFTDPVIRPLRKVLGPVGRVDVASLVAVLPLLGTEVTVSMPWVGPISLDFSMTPFRGLLLTVALAMGYLLVAY